MTGDISPADGAERWIAELRENGCAIIPGLLPPDAIRAIDAEFLPVFGATPFCKGGFYGERTRRFGRLLARSTRVRALVEHAMILDIAKRVLGPYCDTIQLNLAQAIEIHPGEYAQAPHRDQDMWQGEKGRIEYLVNVMWPLTPFTGENGATVLWPGTHGWNALCPDPETAGTPAACEPGSAIVFLGSTLHGGGANRSASARRGIVVGYSLGWLKPYENPFLAYPPAIARTFPPALARLVGYRQHRPNLGNFEGQCPSIVLRDNVPEHPGAIDALTPAQTDMVDAWRAAQRAASAPYVSP